MRKRTLWIALFAASIGFGACQRELTAREDNSLDGYVGTTTGSSTTGGHNRDEGNPAEYNTTGTRTTPSSGTTAGSGNDEGTTGGSMYDTTMMNKDNQRNYKDQRNATTSGNYGSQDQMNGTTSGNQINNMDSLNGSRDQLNGTTGSGGEMNNMDDSLNNNTTGGSMKNSESKSCPVK